MKGDKMIKVEGLTKYFGQFTAVDHISFDVQKGEIFGFLGPNGAGKSTTIRMLCTLLRPSEGHAKIAGHDILKEADEVRQHIGLVAEKLILYDQLTPRENITLFGRLNNMPLEKIKTSTDYWLRRLKMEEWTDHLVGTFSTGMKQRINIARALIHHPDVLFLDEPTLGLDPQTTHAIHEFLRELSEEGITIVLTTHDMAEADSLCQRIAIMDKAKIVALDTVSNLKKVLNGKENIVIDLSILNPKEELIAELRKAQGLLSLSQADTYRFRLLVRAETGIDEILQKIVSLGLKVRDIKTVEPNLEDVFLHLTGREIRDETSEKVPTRRHHRAQTSRAR